LKLSYTPQLLKFKRPFAIAHGIRDSTPVVFTQIKHDGFSGYGEASMPPYVGENHETALRFLNKAKNVIEEFLPNDSLDSILKKIDLISDGNTAAKASIDIALHDLIGKINNTACHNLFATENAKSFFTAFTIPMDNPQGIKERIEEAKEYKLLKVKLGSVDDKKIISEIRKNTSTELIVDANEAWSDKNIALEMIQWLHENNVTLIEQPMPKEQRNDIAWLTDKSPMPIIADEGVQRLSDIEKARGVYSGINIKLMKCTGLHEAKKMIDLARSYDMKIMIGCMSESSCGASAAAQIAPLVDWVDLDGPLLIKNDFFEGIKFSAGQILLSELPGIGVEPIANLFK